MNTNEKHYFPPVGRAVTVNCTECEKQGCPSRGKFQRNRRDLSYTSGRCPRLPDMRGFVEPDEQELYTAAFPLLRASLRTDERHGKRLCLIMSFPGTKRTRKVCRSKACGSFYYTEKVGSDHVKRVVTVHGANDLTDIADDMAVQHTNEMLYRCTVEDYCICG